MPKNVEYTVLSHTRNPAYSTVFSLKFKASFSSKPNQIPTLGIHIEGSSLEVLTKTTYCTFGAKKWRGTTKNFFRNYISKSVP